MCLVPVRAFLALTLHPDIVGVTLYLLPSLLYVMLLEGRGHELSISVSHHRTSQLGGSVCLWKEYISHGGSEKRGGK